MIWSDVYVVLTLVAIHTKRIQIGTGVTSELPHRARDGVRHRERQQARARAGLPRSWHRPYLGAPHWAQTGFRGAAARVFSRRARAAGRRGDRLSRQERAAPHPIHASRPPLHQPRRSHPNSHRRQRPEGDPGHGRARRRLDYGDQEPRGRPALFQRAARRREAARRLAGGFLFELPDLRLRAQARESLQSERVVNEVGSYVTTILHLTYEVWQASGKKDESVPPFFRNIWEDYVKRVAAYSLPPHARFRQIHDGTAPSCRPGAPLHHAGNDPWHLPRRRARRDHHPHPLDGARRAWGSTCCLRRIASKRCIATLPSTSSRRSAEAARLGRGRGHGKQNRSRHRGQPHRS